MSTAAPKTPITHPVAKRFMVVFAVVLLIGIAVEFVDESHLGALIFGIGLSGLGISTFVAVDKKVDQPSSVERREHDASSTSESGCLSEAVGGIIGFVFLVALGLGLLWGLIAIIKWMWIHS